MKAFDEFEKTLDCPATGSLPCSVAENAWREALLWFWKTAEHLSPSDYAILEEELGNETKKD